MENWWLDFNKCLLIGELAESADAKLLNRIISAMAVLVRESKRTVTEVEETWMRLLVSSYGYLNHAQVVRCIAKAFGVTARDLIVSKLVKFLSTVKEEME